MTGVGTCETSTIEAVRGSLLCLRPSFKGISDYPPIDYDDTGRDGLQNWTRIKELIAA
jgi:hypothetical protein